MIEASVPLSLPLSSVVNGMINLKRRDGVVNNFPVEATSAISSYSTLPKGFYAPLVK